MRIRLLRVTFIVITLLLFFCMLSSPTGQFPIAPSDDAYRYDRNPNSIIPAAYQIDLPAMPQVAEMLSCLLLGVIGVLINGGYFSMRWMQVGGMPLPMKFNDNTVILPCDRSLLTGLDQSKITHLFKAF